MVSRLKRKDAKAQRRRMEETPEARNVLPMSKLKTLSPFSRISRFSLCVSASLRLCVSALIHGQPIETQRRKGAKTQDGRNPRGSKCPPHVKTKDSFSLFAHFAVLSVRLRFSASLRLCVNPWSAD